MAKQTVRYTCTSCNYVTIKWFGCCPECNEWDTLSEQIQSATHKKQHGTAAILKSLSEISIEKQPRVKSDIAEWDRVLGGGILPSSLLVLTGDPGIGKSTLLLQVCNAIAQKHEVLYFSTEESLHQVKQRAIRLSCTAAHLSFADNPDLGAIIASAKERKPALIIIDSIQSCFVPGSSSLPGSIGQLREAIFQLMRLAKDDGISIILTGHITKEGIIAGPKTLEHMVDGVFYLQGEDQWQTRILRTVKNRFGTINEIGFFEMGEKGLHEVANINAYMLDDLSHESGAALISVMEGSRPLLLEVQALTIQSKLTMPQRVISGLDHKQVILIAAILEKYLHIKLSSHDIFCKVSGGFKIKGSSSDLGIALSLLSSYFQQPLPDKTIALGEISLTGNIKPINQIGLLVREAEKFNIAQLLLSKKQHVESSSCTLKRFNHVYELLTLFDLKS